MDPMAEIRQTYFQECEDLLEALERGLAAVDAGEHDGETINAIFRAVHSIKGGAGAFGLNRLVRFSHTFETTLDEVRSDRLELSAEVLKVFFRASDTLADLVTALRDGGAIYEEVTEAVVGELSALLKGGDASADTSSEPVDEDIDFQPMKLDLGFGVGGPPPAARSSYCVKFTPLPELFYSANEPIALIRELGEIGDTQVVCDTASLPMLDDLEPESVYISWTIIIETEADESALHEVFQFVDGMCELSIERIDAAASEGEVAAELDDLAFAAVPLQDLPEVGAEAPETEIVPEAPAEPDGVVAPEESPAQSEEKPAPAGKIETSSSVNTTIRVSLERVDQLVNQVGELVVNQAMLVQGFKEAGLDRRGRTGDALEGLQQLTRQIQDSVMAVRAQPVRGLFRRMSRVVREAGNAIGKDVRLVTEGEETEVDKTVIERLADPLTHMIRNAVDHGLETPEQRVAVGKPAQGQVTMKAMHRSGRVIITVSDDGAGINRARVLQKAIEKGLVQQGANLSDSDIDNLIFAPGFSTATEVSDLSGRGVGMDVVTRSLQAVGGRISIYSEEGKGSRFSISLPLTLAVLDGMVIEIDGQYLIAPLTAIVETLQPSESNIHEIGDGSKVICIRGQYLPLIDVAQVLGYRDAPAKLEDSVVLSVETEDGRRGGVIVDGIQDQRQVVIKSLQDNYRDVPGISAATILGDGHIALILDMEYLISRSSDPKPAQDRQLVA